MFNLTIPIVAAGTYAWATYHRNSPLFGAVRGRLRSTERVVALTFDDGPNPDATDLVLRALADARIPATFFLLGRHVERWPEVARAVVDGGHTIGNHGHTHRKLSWAGPALVHAELSGGTAAIARATGATPTLFRAPHGFRSPFVAREAARLGQTLVGWSLGVWDSDTPGEREIARRVVAGVRPGSIALLHDGDGYDPTGNRLQTARALPEIIDRLGSNGYQFVAVS
ncbi:MAG: polysaccharide deacetylase family protein [Gemmatimonadaceae bacterium]